MTAVMMAATNAHEDVLRILLEHGCDASTAYRVSSGESDEFE
jgi:hypothetical protein